MSGIINKVKAKVEELKGDHKTSGSTNAGPHDSNTTNKLDPRVDSDLDGRGVGHSTTGTHSGTGLTGSHGTTGTHSGTGLTGSHGTTGTHSDTGLTGSHHNTGTGSGLTGSHNSNTTAGPYDSNIANKLDPRVDSDLSGGHAGSNSQYTNTGTTGHSSSGIGSGHSNSGIGSTHPVTSGGITGNHTSSSTTAGPHDSNIANKLDPRVDSDLSGGHPGSNTGYSSTGNTGTSGGFSSGISHTHGSTNAGPHDSNIANRADPRVDSDLDGGRHGGLNQTTGTHGTTGIGSSAHGTTGIGSSTHGSTGIGSSTHGTTGVGSSTYDNQSSTGPVHNSNLLNKLDPRVDSTPGGTTHNNQY